MAQVPPNNLATTDLIDEVWVDAVRACIVELQPTPWVAATLQNGWVSFAAAQPLQYRKVGDIVYLRGGVKNGTSGAVVLTLPVGFRPPAQLYFPVLVGGAVAGGYAIANTDGTVVATTPNTGQVELGTLIFSTVA